MDKIDKLNEETEDLLLDIRHKKLKNEDTTALERKAQNNIDTAKRMRSYQVTKQQEMINRIKTENKEAAESRKNVNKIPTGVYTIEPDPTPVSKEDKLEKYKYVAMDKILDILQEKREDFKDCIKNNKDKDGFVDFEKCLRELKLLISNEQDTPDNKFISYSIDIIHNIFDSNNIEAIKQFVNMWRETRTQLLGGKRKKKSRKTKRGGKRSGKRNKKSRSTKRGGEKKKVKKVVKKKKSKKKKR